MVKLQSCNAGSIPARALTRMSLVRVQVEELLVIANKNNQYLEEGIYVRHYNWLKLK